VGRADRLGLAVAAEVGTAGFAGGNDLLVSSDIGLGGSYLLPRAGYLTFVTLGESLVHTLRVHLR
jgi:hypothetical protein